MNNIMFVFKVFALGVLPVVFSQKLAGPFYVVTEGFLPRTHKNDFISYVTELTSDKDDWEDKVISGWFHVKKKVQNLGFILQSWKESGKMWLQRGPPMEFPNLCKLTFSAKNFMECFSGELTKDPCSLEAGNYTLTNYNFEHDLRDTVGNSMFFGHIKYSVTLTGITDGERGSLKFDMILWIKDLDHKQGNGKSGTGKNKNQQKGNQNKNKSDNRNSKKN